MDTPYGKTSDAISLVTVGDKKVAFMPRHGKDHTLNPSEINYRANIDGFCSAGNPGIDLTLLRRFAASGNRTWRFCSHGSCFINMTSGRKDTFNESPNVVHLSSADPYDPGLRQIALEEAEKLGIKTHDGGHCCSG